MLVALDDLSIRMGDLLTLAGAVFSAIQISVVSIYGRDLDVNVSTFWMFVTVAVVCSVPTVMLEPAQVAGVVWAPSLVGVLAFLSVGCTCVAILVQNLALAHVPSATGSLLLSLEPPLGRALLGAACGRDALGAVRGGLCPHLLLNRGL